MPNQPDPRMVQWQMRFENVQRSLSEPRRSNETAKQYEVRKLVSANALKNLQMSKPTGPAPVGSGTAQQPPAPQGGGGMLGGLYSFLAGKLPGN